MMSKNGFTYQTIMKMLKEMSKKVISLFKDILVGNIMIIFVALRPKTCSYLMDDDSKHKKAKGTKNV